MTETKFTPGPWDKGDLLIGKMVDDRKRYTSIAMIHDSEEGYEGEDKANEHLIAAAPDLYEALNEAINAIVEIGISEINFNPTPDELIAIRKTARPDSVIFRLEKTLAKARGETE